MKLDKTRHPGVFTRALADGSKRYVAIVHTSDGRQSKKSFRTLGEARDWRAKHAADKSRGELQPDSKILLRAYAADWLKRYKGHGRRGIRASTLAEYERLLERFAWEWFPARTRLVDVTPHAMSRFAHWLADEKAQGKRLAHATISNAVVPLKAMFSSAVAEGVLRHDPTARLKLPARAQSIEEDDDTHVRALSREQLRTVLERAPERHKLLLATLASTGMRISECVELRWRDVRQTEQPALLVRRACVRGTVGPPKSRHGRRDIPITIGLAEALAYERAHAKDGGDDALVFTSRAGTRLDSDNLRRRMVAPLLNAVGVEKRAGWHIFRHTLASLMLADGANVLQLSRMLGHHAPSFTLDVYSHLLEGESAPALDLSLALAPPPLRAIEGGQDAIDGVAEAA